MTSKLDEAMSKYTDFDSEEVWDRFRDSYIKATPAERIAALQNLDQWLEAEEKPTRALSDLIQRKRQLEHTHFTLRKLGR